MSAMYEAIIYSDRNLWLWRIESADGRTVEDSSTTYRAPVLALTDAIVKRNEWNIKMWMDQPPHQITHDALTGNGWVYKGDGEYVVPENPGVKMFVNTSGEITRTT